MANDSLLQKLRDVHVPDALSVWQVAPGWYFVIFFLIILCVISVIFWKRSYVFWRQKQIALGMLKKYQLNYQNDNNSQLATASVNELLKKLAMVFFSRDKIASLKGRAWLEFLSQKNLNFLSLEKEFLEYPYQPPKNVDLQLFFNLAKAWINNQKIIFKRKDNHV